ncbi:DUF4179 domain-containing protein [Antarcticibacterium flavum]|uniref:DUF4179 domain-containing protein n=1 Tax=Antarcticibacterium flavum TaxID=2058175 RepID=A0A5B7WYK6_9FLAO|nr:MULTISPECIES: DUF4179 domain-containing protein [Antarcticibacterium]MCM4161204.1 hypothetical protein [Antarcticibacterium sp. W02-3]QCY68294.1 DUF4179 domain-containing protein [Antarcticibacterium flavum]
MKYKDIDELFEGLDFDVAEPASGHEDRFLQRLKEKQKKPAPGGKLRMLWSPIAAVAAGLVLIILIGGNLMGSYSLTNSADLAGISPEMKETHQFYTSLITTELAKIEEAKTPETEALVNDALAQLEKLDNDYEKLKKDLKTSGQDKRVIFAMVSNLQQRIDLLNNVLTHIENIKELKNPNNENNII